MQQATQRSGKVGWADAWVSPAGLFTVLAVVFAVATLNSLHVAGFFLSEEGLVMATEKVARAVWWLLLTVGATGVASVLWARHAVKSGSA